MTAVDDFLHDLYMLSTSSHFYDHGLSLTNLSQYLHTTSYFLSSIQRVSPLYVFNFAFSVSFTTIAKVSAYQICLEYQVLSDTDFEPYVPEP